MPSEPIPFDGRPTLVLPEHGQGTLEDDQLSAADHARLARFTGQQLVLHPARGGKWTIKTKGVVGVLTLDRVRLVIAPKFAIGGTRLIDWLAYAEGMPTPHDVSRRRWQTGGSGYRHPVAAALGMECEALLSRGLRRNYGPQAVVEPVLRGRLDVRAQITRGFGTVEHLHQDTFDRSELIAENFVCRGALDAAITAFRSTDRDLVRRLARVADRFPRVPGSVDLPKLAATMTYNRVNTHYQPAHMWARLMLNDGGVTDLLTDAGARGETMLVRMSTLWEKAVLRLVREAVGSGGRAAKPSADLPIRVEGDLRVRDPFPPDVLVTLSETGAHLPVDAKYKDYNTQLVKSGDVHQLLTYIAAYSPAAAQTAFIVYPSLDGPQRRTLRIDTAGRTFATIEVIGIDTRQVPQEAIKPLRDAVKHFLELLRL